MGYARWRALSAAAVVAIGVTLGVAAPAAADVTVVPAQYVQGDSAEMSFRVTNDSPTALLTSAEFRIPEQFSIAEVIPMSVEGWAPSQTMRTVAEPVTGLHGTQTTEVVATLTWTAVPGAELKPGGSVQFDISMFVLPRVATLAIPVVLKFADGSVVNHTGLPGAAATDGVRPAPVATLAPPPAAPADAGDDGGQADEATGGGNSNMLWMFILLVLIGGVTAFALVRQRRAEPLPELDDDDDDRTDDVDESAPSRRERAAL
jgi:periplasmic copper chaperone A